MLKYRCAGEELFTCLVCGHKWYTRKKGVYPLQCSYPDCHSPIWDVGHNVKCFCCSKTVFSPMVHHRNGNHKDNRKENRVAVCSSCHGFIHNTPWNNRNTRGSKRFRGYNYLSEEIKEKIEKLREELNR